MRRLGKRSTCLFLILGLALAASRASADWMPIPPKGYDNYLTYIANGEFDASQPHPFLQNCAGGLCFDDYFGRVIQGRTPNQEARVARQAKRFFLWRFGIDVEDAGLSDAIVFGPWSIDTRVAYRAYVVSGAHTPPRGHEVRDGGYALILNQELTLGGEFDGFVAPAGTTFLFGEYNIAVRRHGRIVREIDISYRSGAPIVPDLNGNVAASCDLHRGRLLSNRFGRRSVQRQGLAQIFGGPPLALDNGEVKFNTRNALTFSETGGGY